MKRIILSLIFVLFTIAPVFAQKLTKEELARKANLIYESGKQREAIDLIEGYPEFSDEVEILYVKSVAYTELRDYKKADEAFQKQFDRFLNDAAESVKMADEFMAETPVSKDNQTLASLMYGTALVSFGSAELVNALRNVAFDKNGMPEAKREPKNLNGFDEFRKNYEEISIKSGDIHLQKNQLKEALNNFSKAIELNPTNPVSYQGRAKVYRKLKKLKLALADEANAKRYASKK